MKFIREMISRKPKEETVSVPPFEDVARSALDKGRTVADPSALPRSAKIVVRDPDNKAPAAAAPAAEQDLGVDPNKMIETLTSRFAEDNAAQAGVNIWDMEDSAEEAPAPVAEPPARRRRNKTRVLGFNGGDNEVVSMFEDAPKVTAAERTKFPVGWMLIEEGPGRGECFTLEAGMSQIGRGEDQAIQLDFGDNSISRSNHAAIVYDTETHAFSIGHGGKKNIVRLNGKPVISNEALSMGDKIKIGETILHFVPLCSEDFNWAADDADSEENEDVAIA